jgi:hypothetical protein
MKHTTASLRYAMSLMTLVLLASLTVLAADGRDFAGIFETSNEVESGEDVSLTFEVEIVNYSGADVLAATVRLENPFDPETALAEWTLVDITNGDRCALTAEVNVPAHEREIWRKGGMPRLIVEYDGADGITFHREVELARGLVIFEGGQP